MNSINKYYIFMIVYKVFGIATEDIPKIDTRIWKGIEPNSTLFCHQASIFKNGHFICGGSIITKNHILTAAHCFSNVARKKYYQIGVNGTKLDSLRIYAVGFIFVHERYGKPRPEDHDIAVIKLKSYLTFDDTVNLISLSNFSHVPSDTECLIAGFGASEKALKPDTLTYVYVKIVLNAICSTYFGTLRKGMICAEGIEPQQGVCIGDSGGGLMCFEKLTGIVSFTLHSYPYCTKTPAVYTDVFYYKDWIKTQLQRESSCIAEPKVSLIVLLALLLKKC
ncbi:unnamed protein product [Brassicogethes aeneus]|uniref:Peptidase S1 domain-containing protein n=1 Tax=Brassicogethes aeneus TaxID=1431903 RepID=A0A9P0ASU5_BRAAE|nr:unnamed protein product [Brassicogethes aeneus]